MKYLTGFAQSLAVIISTVYIGTARFCANPVKYFTVKKFASLAIVSQNPGFIEIQVLELVSYKQFQHLKSQIYIIYIFL